MYYVTFFYDLETKIYMLNCTLQQEIKFIDILIFHKNV